MLEIGDVTPHIGLSPFSSQPQVVDRSFLLLFHLVGPGWPMVVFVCVEIIL